MSSPLVANGQHYVLYVDGSVRSGGRAGIGVVLATEDGYPVRRLGEPLPHPVTSTTEAEYIALLKGLEEALRLGAESIEIYTDSSIVHGQLCLGWACNSARLQPLKEQAEQLLSSFRHWELHRIPSERNQLVHAYAALASDKNRKRFWQRPRKRNSINTQEEVRNTMKWVVTTPTQTLPDDVYVVELLDVQQQTGAYGEQFLWKLRVAEGEFAGTELRAWANASTAVNSKAVRWASAFAAQPFTAGDTIDLNGLRGRRARAIVQAKQTSDGREFARVSDILPLRKQQQQEEDDPFLEED